MRGFDAFYACKRRCNTGVMRGQDAEGEEVTQKPQKPQKPQKEYQNYFEKAKNQYPCGLQAESGLKGA